MSLPPQLKPPQLAAVSPPAGQSQPEPTPKTTPESLGANGIYLALNSEIPPLPSPASFPEALHHEPEQSLVEQVEEHGNGTEALIQSECPQAHATDRVALAGGHVLARGDVSLLTDVTLSPASKGCDRPLEKNAPMAIPSRLSYSSTIAFPLPEASRPPPTPPPSNAPDCSVPERASQTTPRPTTPSDSNEHQASTSPPPPVLACGLGLSTDITSLPSPPASHSSPESEPVRQPEAVLSANPSPRNRENSSGNNMGNLGRSFSSVARSFLPKRNGGFFKWPWLKGKDLHTTPAPIPPLSPCTTITISTGAGGGPASELGLKKIQVAPSIPLSRTLTTPPSPNSPLVPCPSPSSVADRTTDAARALENREAEEANTEQGKKRPSEPGPPLSPLPTSPNVSVGSPGVKPGKKGKWHFAEPDDDDSETSSVRSESERESEDELRGRALSRVGGAQEKVTSAVPAPPINVALSIPPKASLDQNTSHKAPPPTLKLEVPSLSDVNLATLIFSGADTDRSNERTEEVDVVSSGSPAETMAVLSPVGSPFSASTKVASSEEGHFESTVGKRGDHESDDESQDPFYADAQMLTPGPSPTSPTNGTLSTTFVFPPPGVSRFPASTFPLPPSPVSPTSSHHRPHQLSPSPESRRKSILGTIRLVGTLKRGVMSKKKNASANNASPPPKSSPARSKTIGPGAKQSNSRPRPMSMGQAPDPRRSSTVPQPRSVAHGGDAGDGRYLMIPLSPGTPTQVQVVRKERQPLSPTMHTGGTIEAETSEIMDPESRRLSEIAFM